VAPTPQDASPREYNKKGRGGPPAASTTANPLMIRWGVELLAELKGAKAEVLAEGEWWDVKIKKVTATGQATYTYDGPLGDGDSGITESVKIGSSLIRPPAMEEADPGEEEDCAFKVLSTPPRRPSPRPPHHREGRRRKSNEVPLRRLSRRHITDKTRTGGREHVWGEGGGA